MDILVELPLKDIQALCKYYENYQEYAPHVFIFLNNVLKWHKKNNGFIHIYAPNGKWLPDGTFIAILRFSCYDLFIFTMDKSCLRLSNALKTTKIINWTEEVLIYALHMDLYTYVIDVLRQRQIPISFVQESDLWIRKSQTSNSKLSPAIKYPCGYFLGFLNTNHAKTINDVWPYRYKNSENYIKTLIEFNGGRGIFTNNNQLVAWCLRNSMGQLGILQTQNGYKKKGFGASVLNALCHDVTVDGIVPMATISMGNKASHAVFSKCGFQRFVKCYYIAAGKSSTIAFDADYDFGLTIIF